MDFELSEEQRAVKEKAAQFAEKYIKPRALEIDKTGEFPVDIFKKLGEEGFMKIPFSEEWGGAGGDTLSYMLAVEEIAKACASTGLSYAASISLGISPIYNFGTKEQKEKWLPDLISGKKLASFGLTEVMAGSDASGTETTAVLENGEYVINGQKRYITNASYASVILVTAITGETANGRKRISGILVPTDTPGVTIKSDYDKMGVRGSDTAEINLEDVRVPAENLLGGKEDGYKFFMQTLDAGRISIGANSLGVASAAFESSLDYSKKRNQFGNSLSKFQAIQFKLADMAMEIELARNMVHKAAWLKDQGKPFAKEASFAKLFASETAVRAGNEAIQIHGGYGYMRENGVERHLRDAKLLVIGEGTSEIQRIVIAKHLGC
ncbi:acyl-CoA dehydrogenase family protein [Aciduricibacillus chroicocephali]|uniref:Acyl-CoA dehydrogenase family protein n=1 Tax=Aciduricibacillus chroicocephali TaxID=3054939 RepID=A0ABY9L269_9BACI|nr:acyl-CoA dehydrogenase family protein [Bacillaceae bacterium 44XB]